MPARPARAESFQPSWPGWPYVVLTVLLAAVGNDWTSGEVRTLGYVLVVIVAVASALPRRH
ncbi:hypothetical protein [Streptomyces cremeus]|uniref:Uncharacterized protein n=1 Tax=Streptomyces cremeus TaxID=66881 RepID=A0ABV5P7T4_STRCM